MTIANMSINTLKKLEVAQELPNQRPRDTKWAIKSLAAQLPKPSLFVRNKISGKHSKAKPQSNKVRLWPERQSCC